MFRFEKLDVWHKAIEMTDLVYAATRPFPDSERFGLTSQMRRASVSIASNVAEGSSRISQADFLRFIEIAYGSLMEVVTQSMIAKRQGFLLEQQYLKLHRQAEELSRMPSGPRASLLPSADR